MTFPSSAFPATTRSTIVAGIFLIVGVALWAISLQDVEIKGVGTANVFPLANWIKVIRVHAAANAAQMIQCQTFRNGTTERFVGKAMGAVTIFPGGFVESAIAEPQGTHPNPTTGFRDRQNERQERFDSRLIDSQCDSSRIAAVGLHDVDPSLWPALILQPKRKSRAT